MSGMHDNILTFSMDSHVNITVVKTL